MNPSSPSEPGRRLFGWRGILIGFVGVVAIGLLSYWNDRVVQNSSLTNSYFPPAATLMALVLIGLVNAPLLRWRPAWALGRGDIAIAIGMMLVGSSLPNIGLMRYLPGHIIGFYHNAAQSTDADELMNHLSLPDWPFVEVKGETAAERGRSPEVSHFDSRIPEALSGTTIVSQLQAIPWHAWIKPIWTWGIFLACLFGAILCALVIFRSQWSDNERLPFPIAGIYSMLIEPPAPGRAFNRLLSDRGFWISVGVVFFVRGMNGLNAYYPEAWPKIPLNIDLRMVFAENPWNATSWAFQSPSISFTLIGIAYFLQSSITLSLWIFFILLQVVEILVASRGAELGWGRRGDMLIGSFVPYGVALLWVARRHLAMVGRQMLGRRRAVDAPARYLPYPVAGWGMLVCAVGLVLWLMAAGTSAVGAVVIVSVLLSTFLILARIVAETGLPFVTFDLSPARLWVVAAQDLPAGLSPRTTGASYFWSNTIDNIFLQDKSQAHPPHVVHALRLSDRAYESELAKDPDRARSDRPRSVWRYTFPVFVALCAAFAASYTSSFVGSLWAEYTYADSMDRNPTTPLNAWGSTDMPRQYTIDRTIQYLTPAGGPREGYTRPLYLGIGATLAAMLSVLRLRFAGWPLHPVGFLLCTTFAGGVIWLSMLIAWLAKTIILRLGGGSLYVRAQPMFVGLVIGDACSAVFWIMVTLMRLGFGLDYVAVRV
jgi:hypothetical protein